MSQSWAKKTTGGGGGGSVTSTAFVSLVNRVSSNSAQTTSIANAVSVLSNTLSAETASRISADNALSNAISALSASQAITSTNVVSITQQLSALSIRVDGNSADMTSIKNAFSSAINIISNALSSEIIDRISADTVLENQISTVSVAAASKNQKLSIANQGSVFIVDPSKLDFTGNAVSAYLSGSVSKIHISVTPATASVTSAEYASLVNRVSGNSTQMTSADNALSDAISIVSVAQANTSAAVTSVNNRVSAISTDVTSIHDQVSAILSDLISIHNVTSNLVSEVSRISLNVSALSTKTDSLSNSISVVSAAQAATSAAVTSVNQVVSALSVTVANNSAQMTSADNALSNAILAASALAASKNVKMRVFNQGSIVITDPSNFDFTGNAVSAYLSVSTVVVNISTTGGTASVTSAEYLSLVDRVSANSAQMTSADNAISNAVSIVSVAQANTSAAVTSVNNRVSAISTNVTSALNLISAISQQVSVLSARVASNSVQMVSADNAISNAVSIVSVAAAAKNLIITVLDEGATILSNPTAIDFTGAGVSVSVSGTKAVIIIPGGAGGGSVTSTDFVSLRGLVQGNSADFTSFKASINNFGDVSAVPTADQQVMTWNSAAGQWVASTITAGVGSVTSAELSAVSAAAKSAIDIVSAQVASVNSALLVRIGGILDTQIRITSTLQSTAGSALVDVSGLILTVAADQTWRVEGYLLISTSAATAGLKMGFSVPVLSTPRYTKIIAGSAAQSATVAGGGGLLQISGSSALLSITGIGPAGAAVPVKFDAMFNVASAGTFTLQACGIASTAASPMHFLPGSYMIAYRIK